METTPCKNEEGLIVQFITASFYPSLRAPQGRNNLSR
jgi:hypothetical protein